MTIGERLAELRKSRGLSQEDLAEQLTLTRQTISKWELGQSSPDIEYVISLCEFFGISTDYLLKGEEPPVKEKEEKKEEQTQPSVFAAKDPAQEKRWMIISLGMMITSLAFLVMVFFVIMSIIHPWATTVPSGKTYTGLYGYLLGTDTLPYFIAAAVVFLIGLGVAVFGIVKKNRKEREE